MNTPWERAVMNIVRQLARSTDDARQLLIAGDWGERLVHEIRLSSALAAQLERVVTLRHGWQSVEEWDRADGPAREAIAKAAEI